MAFMHPRTQTFLITEWLGTGQAPALSYQGGKKLVQVWTVEQLQITCLLQLLHIYITNVNHKLHLTD